MNSKFQNKYRIDSIRLKNWDYGTNGAYFITICTKNRKRFFGEIANNKMVLNEIGCLAYNFWAEIPKHFPFVELGNFQIMPNHTHGILIINKKNFVDETIVDVNVETLQCNVSTTNDKNQKMSKISPKSGTISTIIRSYKSVVTNHARYANPDFGWQARFWDNIIWNSESFERIQNYIEKNPENWKEDKFYNT
jgi:putative transposase